VIPFTSTARRKASSSSLLSAVNGVDVEFLPGLTNSPAFGNDFIPKQEVLSQTPSNELISADASGPARASGEPQGG